jgi:hypothetical protein
MNIDEWLEATCAPVEGSLAGYHGIAPFLQRANREVHAASQRKRRKQGNSIGESSLLEELVPQQSDAATAHHGPHRQIARSSPCSVSSRLSSATSPSASIRDLYRKRPRRKTRPEKYATGIHRRKKQRSDRSEGGKGQRKKRRARHGKVKHTAGLLDKFQAKNVTKTRLTVRRQAKLSRR